MVIVSALALTVATLGVQPGPSAGQTKLVMAFVPSSDAQRVLATGSTIARMLEVATGYSIEATVPTSYAATIEALCAGRVHIAWFAPTAYVLANARRGGPGGLVSGRGDLP